MTTDQDALRMALRDAVRILEGGRQGYVGDHYIREVQVKQSTVDRLRAALTGAPTSPPLDERAIRLHPGQHEFRTICRLCGEDGMLHVSVITHQERVAITDVRQVDTASELGRLLAERDRLIGEGVDPADLLVPEPPGEERP